MNGDPTNRPSKKRYSVARGGEDEPGLILIADDEKGVIVARSSDMALKYVQELVDFANRSANETNDIARDAARYRFLRQPGNAIVYAKDRDAWGRNASGHVRYDTAEQLDAAVDAASNAVKASETSEDARLAESVTGFLEHAEKHGLQTEDQLAESQLTKANEPAPPPTDEGARLQPTGSASGTEWKGMGGGAAVRCPHGVVVENPRDWLGWSFCEKCPDCIATWKDEGSPLLLTKRRIREIARHCNPTLTDGEFAAMWMTWMLAGPP